jgi:hypothetical protein
MERRPKLGYFKNELIAQQVEEADRIPAPIPASRHVSLQYKNKRFVGPIVLSKRTYYRHTVIVIVLALALGVLIGVWF